MKFEGFKREYLPKQYEKERIQKEGFGKVWAEKTLERIKMKMK